MNTKQNHDANMNSLVTSHGNAYGEGQYQKHIPQSFRSHRDLSHRQHHNAYPSMMSYRESPRSPPRVSVPSKPDNDDFDPPSPEPPCGYDDDRIQNDLLDEICSDIGIKDAIDLDVFDFDTNTDQYIINQTKLPDDLDNIEQTLGFNSYPGGQQEHLGTTQLPPYSGQKAPVTTSAADTTVRVGPEVARSKSDAIASPTISSSCNPNNVTVTNSCSRPGSVDSMVDSPAVHSTSTHLSHQSNMSTSDVKSESHLLGTGHGKMPYSPVPSPAYSQGSMGPPSTGPPSVPDHTQLTVVKPKQEPSSGPSNKPYIASQPISSQPPVTHSSGLPLESPHKVHGSSDDKRSNEGFAAMPAPNFLPPRPVSRDRQGHARPEAHFDVKTEGGGQGMAEVPCTDAGYFSTGSASAYTGSHYGSSTTLSSPPDHNQASAKEKVLRYLNTNVPNETPDFELDNYRNGQYTMEAPLGTESAVSSAPSSPPQHLAKRARVIQSGTDLLAEMRDRYSFTKGADMYAQPNKMYHQEMPLVKPNQNPGYNFSGAAGNGQTPQVPCNFNFAQNAQQRNGSGQFSSSQQQQNFQANMPGGQQRPIQPRGVPEQGVPGPQQQGVPQVQNTNFGPFAQSSNNGNQGMYGSCPNLSTSKPDGYGGQPQNMNNNMTMDKNFGCQMNPQQGNMGPPAMPGPMTPNNGPMRGPSPMQNGPPSLVNRQFPQQVVSAPNSPSKFMHGRQSNSMSHGHANVSCKNVLFRPLSTPHNSGNVGPNQRIGQSNTGYGLGQTDMSEMHSGPGQQQQQQHYGHQNASPMGHQSGQIGHQPGQMGPPQQRMNPQNQQNMMPPNQMNQNNPNQMNPSMYGSQNQGMHGGQHIQGNQQMGPGMHPGLHGPPNTEVPLSENGFMQSIMDNRSTSFRSHPLFPLLRDLIIADMNFHTPSFPFQLIANLPADFDRLLNNYLTRNPPMSNYPTNDGVQGVIMDALKYAHSALIEKIQARKQREGYKEPDRPLSAIEDFCERFDRAVKNTMQPTMGEMPMGGHPGHMHPGNPFDNPHAGMPPPQGNMGLQGPHTPIQPSHMGMPPGYGGGLRQFHERQTHSLPASPRKFGRHLSHDGYTSDSMSDSANNSSHEQPPERKPQPTQGKNKVLPKEAVNLMLDWLRANQDNPYPNDDEKEMLIQKTKLTINQINYWFTNARRRILPKWALQRYMDQQQKQKDLDPKSGSISSNHPASPMVGAKR